MARPAAEALEADGRRQPEPRSRIIRSAARLFREQGYSATSLRDVAREVGMSKAGLYHYFASKEGLLEQVYERAVSALEADLENVLAVSGAEARIRAFVVERVRTIAREQDVMTVFWQERPQISEEVFRAFEDRLRRYRNTLLGLIEQARSEGAVRRDLDPYLVMLGLDGMTCWFCSWYREEGRLSVDEIGAQLAEFGWSAARPRDR